MKNWTPFPRLVHAVGVTLLLTVSIPAWAQELQAPADTPWLDSDWSRRIPLSVDPAQLDPETTLTGFPLLLDGAVLDTVFGKARSDGADIVVTADDGTTILPHELVVYDGQQKAELWFQADSLSTTKTDFYVYYGNDTAAPRTKGAVWPADYAAVYHFQENPGDGTLVDWTAAGNDARADQARSNWTASDVAAGKAGQGWHFNGSSHFINTTAIRTQDAGYTVSAWMLHETRGTDFAFQANPGFWHVSSQASDATNNIQYQTINPTDVDVRWPPNPIPLDEFHHFAWVFRPADGVIDFYYDGVAQSPMAFWPPETDPTDYYVGHPLNPGGSDLVGILGPMLFNDMDLMNGIGDEFRVSDDEKSAAWIAAEFANQSSPPTFFVVGPEQDSAPTQSTNWGDLKSRW